MGFWFSRFVYLPCSGCFQPESLNVLVVGATDAGKTTTLYRLTRTVTDSSDLLTLPTTGFNVEILTHYAPPGRGKTITKVILWEMGSKVGMQHLWSNYIVHCEAILFVLDSKACNTEDGLARSKEVIDNFMTVMDLKQKNHLPIYVMANKQDLGEVVLTPLEIRRSLCLDGVFAGKKWVLGSGSALTGDGLKDAINWLVEQTFS